MTPIQSAALYILGAIILAALTGYGWLLPLGGLLALSAMARHLFGNER